MQHESKRLLNEMLTETGHVLDAEDFDDIAELDRLAAEVADPRSGIDSPLMNHAVFFRRVPVYPLTLAHLTYLDEVSELIGIKSDAERILSMLWITTIPEIRDEHYDGVGARKRFKAWARKSPWTPADIDAILDLRYSRILSNQEPTSAENKDGALIGMLTREYGETPEYWMREAPIGVIESCVADWNAQQEAQAAAFRKANKGAAVAPAPSPKFVAMRKLRECAERIKAKWQKNAA